MDERRKIELEEIERYRHNGWGIEDCAADAMRARWREASEKSQREWLERERIWREKSDAEHRRECEVGRAAYADIQAAWTAAEAEAKERWATVEAGRIARANERRRSMAEMLPERFREASARDYSGATMETFSHLMARGRVGGLSVLGPVGCGKTHLVCALLLELSGELPQAHFTGVQCLLDELKAAMSGDDGEYELTLARPRGCRLLVLDDLWAGRETDFCFDVLEGIISYRYERNLPTWVTSNAEFSKAPPHRERMVSRLMEMNGKPVVMRGKDRRRP